jgi:hypothetical protein
MRRREWDRWLRANLTDGIPLFKKREQGIISEATFHRKFAKIVKRNKKKYTGKQ